jgi:ferredoxin
LRVNVDMNLCQSHGECVTVAPDVFQLGDDDVLVWQEDVSEDRREAVQEAVNVCPMMAISIDEA